MTILLVSLAGGIGAATRFVFDGAVNRRFRGVLPAGTLAINIIGSFLLGLITGAASHHLAGVGPDVRSIAGTGFCGGFTTFSTASVETLRLWRADGIRPSTLYAVATLVGALLAAALGIFLTS